MPRKFKFCIHCRRSITESMIGRGEFVKTRFGLLCTACAQQLEEEPPPPEPPKPEEKPAPPEPPPEPKPEPKPEITPEQVIAQVAEQVAEKVAGKVAEEMVGKVAEEVVKKIPPPPPPPPPPEPPKTVEQPTTLVMPPAAPPLADVGKHVQLLDAMRQHLEAIRQSLMFEKSSSWTVVAVVAQCLAAGVFVIAIVNWLENPLNLLLSAIMLQLVALTFFIKGK